MGVPHWWNTDTISLNGDDDPLLERGEIFEVDIDFTAMVTPNTISAWGLYPHPYESWQNTLKPTQGGTLTLRRTLGTINRTVEAIY